MAVIICEQQLRYIIFGVQYRFGNPWLATLGKGLSLAQQAVFGERLRKEVRVSLLSLPPRHHDFLCFQVLATWPTLNVGVWAAPCVRGEDLKLYTVCVADMSEDGDER